MEIVAQQSPIESKISTHPYAPFIPKTATKLIIGTIPPPRFCLPTGKLEEGDVNFYYGSRHNGFWKLVAEVFAIDFSYENSKQAVQEREDFLEKNNLGITDIIASCIHEDNSAADDDLTEIKTKDIEQLLNQNPQIETLCYTSEFVKKYMYKALGAEHSSTEEGKRIKILKLNNREWKVKILYSPSPSALRGMGKNGVEKRLAQYRKFLL